MKKNYQKIGAWISTLPVLLIPAAALAQIQKSKTLLEDVGKGLGEEGKGKPLPELIGGLIRVFLGVLGIVFVVLVVYAGYLWMTSSGEATKVDKAKKLLGQAIIGIVIIVAAYAITGFVLEQVISASTGA